MGFDDKYIFRVAKEDDIDIIMDFIGRYWKKDHILARDKEFFKYMYLFEDRVNAVLAIERSSGRLAGWESFIQYSKELKDISGTMWKIAPWVQTPFLGLEIIKRVKELTSCNFYGSPGTNPKTALILHGRFFKHQCFPMKQYYKLNIGSEYKIAVINEMPTIAMEYHENVKLLEIMSFDEFKNIFDDSMLKKQTPYKDYWYINRRYFNHPVYKYKCLWIDTGSEKSKGVFIAREVFLNGTKILRIMDYLGDFNLIALTGLSFDKLIEKEGYEYIDFYCYPGDDNIMEKAGFALRKEDDVNIIPNYFEPFVQNNIEIYCAVNKDCVLYKGDGDQDRPS